MAGQQNGTESAHCCVHITQQGNKAVRTRMAHLSPGALSSALEKDSNETEYQCESQAKKKKENLFLKEVHYRYRPQHSVTCEGLKMVLIKESMRRK